MSKKRNVGFSVLFGLYVLGMLVLLFHRAPREGYHYNLIPFAIIRDYFTVMAYREPETLGLQLYGWVNFLGNLLAFFPLGLFLPLLFRRQQSFPVFLLTVTLTVCLVELLQLLTHRGALDVDDLILNLPGACLGWLTVWLLQRRKKRLE